MVKRGRHRGKLKGKYKSVQIGNIRYKILLTDTEFKCPCGTGNNPCDHVKKLLSGKNLPQMTMFLFHNLKVDILKNIDDSNIKTIINDKITQILDEDCGVCCEKLSRDPKKLGVSICKSCNKLAHSKCYIEWANRKKGCMYCRK